VVPLTYERLRFSFGLDCDLLYSWTALVDSFVTGS
jgi:hypothetical protein